MAVTKRNTDKSVASNTDAKATETSTSQYGYEHGGWEPELTKFSHSFTSYIIVTAISLALAFYLNSVYDVDFMNRGYAMHNDYYFPKTGVFLAFYYCFLLFSRWYGSDSHVLYEQVWACNTSMLLSSIGMIYNIPLFTGLSCALVSVDQMCWYIDILVWVATGFKKFPIGVANYLTWPTTSTMKRVTAAHHLWFLPVMLHTLGYRLPENSFLLAVIVGSSLCAMSRFMTPFHCLLPQEGTAAPRVLYLNINASYAFWKDVKLGALHLCDHMSPIIYIPFVMFVGNFLLNWPAVMLLNLILSFVPLPVAA